MLVLVTGVEELGSWEAADAKQMLSTDGKTWSIKVELKPHTTISYKYIRIFSGDDKSWVQWEKGPNSRDREFRWDGKTTIQDDEEVSSFLETRELQIISHNSESQELGQGGYKVCKLPNFCADAITSAYIRICTCRY